MMRPMPKTTTRMLTLDAVPRAIPETIMLRIPAANARLAWNAVRNSHLAFYWRGFERVNPAKLRPALQCTSPQMVRQADGEYFKWYNYARWRLLHAVQETRRLECPAEVFCLVGEWAAEVQKVETILVEAHMAAAVKLAMRMPSGAIDDDDWRAASVIGLLRAIKRFDPGRGIRFITYAWFAIMNSLVNARRLHARNGHVNIDEAMELPAPERPNGELIDIRHALAAADLTADESSVIAARFGIGCTPGTLDEVAAWCGFARSRVLVLQKTALSKLSNALAS